MDSDDVVSKSLIGFGRKRLNVLIRDMGYQKLRSHSNTIMLPNGYRINANSSYGVNKVTILPPTGPRRRVQVEYECFCNCNFAIGQITEIRAEGPLNYLEVRSCQKDKYTLFENILGSDFTPWRVDDVVIVMAYNAMLFDCDKNNSDATGCFPVKDIVNEVGDSAWRTTLRVLPICALTQPKWIKYAEPV